MGNSSARAVVDVGSVIADTYTIEGLIGKGGMGTVFMASHNRLPGKLVAIKLLHTDHEDEEILARFRREALIASQLNHPNIVAVHDFNVMADGTPYLILEFLQGESLASRIDTAGALGLESVFAIMRQVGSAIAAAHQHGIVHRDLKPQNIFLVPVEADGGVVEVAKVLDFGISKIRGSSTVKTQESSLLGTPQYMAPEQATGQHPNVDERTDIFALGAIAYEMIAGRPAFTGASIPEVVFKVVYEPPAPLADASPETPPHVIDAIMKAMAKQQSERFATVSDFVEALTGMPIVGRVSATGISTPDVGFATGSRIRPPGTGPGKSGVGRSGGVPITGSGKTASQSGKSSATAAKSTAASTNPGATSQTASASGRTPVVPINQSLTPSQSGKTERPTDALARTMDSGDHGSAATMPQMAAVTEPEPVPPEALTLDSLPPGNDEAASKPVAPPVAKPVVVAPDRGRPIGLIVGLVAAGMVVSAVCVYLVVKGGGQPGTAQPVALAGADAAAPSMIADAPIAMTGIDAHTAVATDAAVVAAVDAAIAVDAAVTDKTAGRKPGDTKPPRDATTPPASATLSEEERAAKERLARAEQALRLGTEQGNDEALRLAHAVGDDEKVKRFHARAYAIQGVLKCRGNLGIEARTLLAKVRHDAYARNLLVSGCAAAGEKL